MTDEFSLCGTPCGPTHPPVVIAEISANHNGDIDIARRIIKLAKDAGASVVKFQHYKPELITVRSELPEFQISGGTIWDGRQLYDLYEEAMMPWEWTEELARLCGELGLGWFSSPFDRSAVDFLEELGIQAYKVASFELVDLPLIAYMASTGKPLVVSTGMATMEEIEAAVDTAFDAGAHSLSLLRCNSGYPARFDEMDLNAIPTLRKRFDCQVGLSDHTIGSVASITAVGLGATIFEKHISTDESEGSADELFSANGEDFTQYVQNLKWAWEALGIERFGPSKTERQSLPFRRSLRASQAISKGESLTVENVRSMRPAGGLSPHLLNSIVGSRARFDLEAGQAIDESTFTFD